MQLRIATAACFLVACLWVAPAWSGTQQPINPTTIPHPLPMSAPERDNLQTVLQWWREVIEGGHLERVPHFQAESYIQHNPNINTGRAGFLEAFGKDNSPVNPIPARLENPPPLAGARGDFVWILWERRRDPSPTNPSYYQNRFELLRMHATQVQEHWDADLKHAGTGVVRFGQSPQPPEQFDTGKLTAAERAARRVAIEAATQVYLKHKVELADRLIAPDYIEHDPNLAQVTGLHARLAAFDPPARLEADEPVIAIVNGEYVAMMWNLSSPDPDDATRAYPWNYFQLVRVVGGRVVEHWDQDAWHERKQETAQSAQATNAVAGRVTAVQCGHLVDVIAGKVLGASTVVIDGTRIREVLAGSNELPGATKINLSAQTCLPGLIDSHTHLNHEFEPTTYADTFRWNIADYAVRSTVYARRTLLAGFTTVRNLGDSHNETAALRDAINARVVVGPRILTAGKAIGSTGGHTDPTNGYRDDLAGDPGVNDGIINSPDQAAKAVRLHYKAGDDVIKIMASGGVLSRASSGDNPQLTLEEIKAIVSTAHDYGFAVAAHAHSAESIRRAVLGGVDSIEHGTYMDDTDMKLMKERGTWYVPTIIAGEFVAQQAKVPGFYPPQVATKAAAIGPLISKTAGRAYKAGVKIAFGTDAGVYPHGRNAHELELMVQAGMPPMFALQAATVNASQLLRKDKDLGSVSAGKLADLIAVPGNPLDDISLMKQVSFVMKEGIVYKENGRAVDVDPP